MFHTTKPTFFLWLVCIISTPHVARCFTNWNFCGWKLLTSFPYHMTTHRMKTFDWANEIKNRIIHLINVKTTKGVCLSKIFEKGPACPDICQNASNLVYKWGKNLLWTMGFSRYEVSVPASAFLYSHYSPRTFVTRGPKGANLTSASLTNYHWLVPRFQQC